MVRSCYKHKFSKVFCDDLERWEEAVRGSSKREGMYVRIWLIHLIVQQKLTQNAKHLYSNKKITLLPPCSMFYTRIILILWCYHNLICSFPKVLWSSLLKLKSWKMHFCAKFSKYTFWYASFIGIVGWLLNAINILVLLNFSY